MADSVIFLCHVTCSSENKGPRTVAFGCERLCIWKNDGTISPSLGKEEETEQKVFIRDITGAEMCWRNESSGTSRNRRNVQFSAFSLPQHPSQWGLAAALLSFSNWPFYACYQASFQWYRGIKMTRQIIPYPSKLDSFGKTFPVLMC